MAREKDDSEGAHDTKAKAAAKEETTRKKSLGSSAWATASATTRWPTFGSPSSSSS